MRKWSITKGLWYIGGHKRWAIGGFPLLAASLAGPILGGIVGPILKKNNRTKTTTKKTECLETTLYWEKEQYLKK